MGLALPSDILNPHLREGNAMEVSEGLGIVLSIAVLSLPILSTGNRVETAGRGRRLKLQHPSHLGL